jgi:cytochrome P450
MKAQRISAPLDQFEALVAGSTAVDRHQMFAWCRAESPIFYSEALGSWVLSRWDDVRGVLEDEVRFASLVDEPGASLQRTFLQMTGREHNKKAGIVARVIRSPRAFTEGLDDAVREISRRTAEQLVMGEPIDFKADYAMWVPLLVITELTRVDEAAKFRDWYQLIASGGVASVARPDARAAGLKAVGELREFLEPIIAERRRHPATDLVSTLATSSYDDQPLSEEEIVSTLAFLLTAGVETTERALASLFRHLLLSRDAWDDLVARREDRNFLTSVSAESLRLFPPVQLLTRRTTEPVSFHDVEIPLGDRVVVILASANRDDERFDDPQRFVMTRFLDRPERQFTTNGEIMPFGAGGHHCTGARLAVTEMVHAIREFAARVDWMEATGHPPPGEGFMLHSPPAVPMILHPRR